MIIRSFRFWYELHNIVQLVSVKLHLKRIKTRSQGEILGEKNVYMLDVIFYVAFINVAQNISQ